MPLQLELAGPLLRNLKPPHQSPMMISDLALKTERLALHEQNVLSQRLKLLLWQKSLPTRKKPQPQHASESLADPALHATAWPLSQAREQKKSIDPSEVNALQADLNAV